LPGKELKAGLELSLKAAERIIGDLRWSRLGIVTFKDEELLSSKSALVAPEFLLLSMAVKAVERDIKAILVLNARKQHALNLSGQEGLRAFLDLLGPDGPRPLYFGVSGEGHLASLDRARLSISWLAANPGVLARLIEAASPVERRVKEIDLSSLEALSALLVEKLGPPSLKEDVVVKIKGANKYEVAADALSTAAAVISPTSLLATGIKYAAKFFSLVRERRKEEYKAYLETWKKNVEEAFSVDKLSALLCEDDLEPIQASLEQHGLAVIIHDVMGTPHELFLPLLLLNMASELGQGGLLMIVDGAAHLARLGLPVELLACVPERHPGVRMACFIPTGDVPRYEKLPDLVKIFTSKRAAIFDLEPFYVDVLCGGRSAAFRAALLRGLEEAARERLAGSFAFVFYDEFEHPLPEVLKLKLGLLKRLKDKITGLRRSGT